MATKLTNAPERIYATVNGAGTSHSLKGERDERYLIGGWESIPGRPRAVEYIRADLAGRQALKEHGDENNA